MSLSTAPARAPSGSTDHPRDVLESWHLSPSTNRDYHFLDGIRGVAILMVLTCHFIYVNPHAGPALRFIGDIALAGKNGVPLFFALSGFLISWPFWKRRVRGEKTAAPAGYGWRRFYKIYPPLCLSILLLTPFYILRTGDSSYLQLALKWLVWVPLFFRIDGRLNPVMWSLVIEVQFYIVLPLLMLCLKRISTKTCLWLVPVLFFVVGIGQRSFQFWKYGLPVAYVKAIDFPFPSGLDFFALGVLIAGLHSQRKITASHARWAWAGVALLIGMIVWGGWLQFASIETFPLDETVSLGVKVACGLILLCVGNPRALLSRVFSHPALRWCGIISYEWYLFHQPLATTTRQIFGSAEGNIFRYSAILAGPFLVSVVFSAAVYRFFSLPILRFGRSRHSE
jgi:peptidoglycan/LPS O-acetylase OafA/YrhL